jgi:hypothetical protein
MQRHTREREGTLSNPEPLLHSRHYWAKRLDVCEATLARAAKAGRLSYVRLGDRILHSARHIDEWLARNERQAGR